MSRSNSVRLPLSWDSEAVCAVLMRTEDGKEMKFQSEKLNINSVIEEMDRHSRILARKDDLSGN